MFLDLYEYKGQKLYLLWSLIALFRAFHYIVHCNTNVGFLDSHRQVMLSSMYLHD